MTDQISDFFSLILKLSSLLELGTLVVLLGLSAVFAHGLRQQVKANSRAGGLRQVAFPLLAIVLLSALRFVAHHNGWHLHFVAVVVQLLWAMVAIRVMVFAVQRVFPDAIWMRTFGRTIAALVWFCVALDFLGVLPDLIDWLDGVELPLGKTHLSLWAVMQGLASVLGAVIVALWVGGVIEGRLAQISGMDSNLRVVVARITKAVLIFLAIMIGMELVGLDITTLSVFGGALGVGLGFGMQKIASNYVSGFIILLDHSIRIGNMIQVGTERGEVLQITTRYTVLRSLSGVHFLVPNETLVSGTVQNDSFRDPRTRVALRVGIGYNSDLERALQILEEIAKAESRVINDPPPGAFFISFGDSSLVLELGFWIADPGNGTTGVISAVNREILRRFREEGIEIPFPQQEVRLLNAGELAGRLSEQPVSSR